MLKKQRKFCVIVILYYKYGNYGVLLYKQTMGGPSLVMGKAWILIIFMYVVARRFKVQVKVLYQQNIGLIYKFCGVTRTPIRQFIIISDILKLQRM